MQYYYSNPNYVGYQQNGTTAQAVVPGSYPVNRVNAYNNPYCNVNAIPAQGSGGFVNPTQVSGMQQNFVGQITYAAPTNPMVMQEPVRDYYNWKLTNNIHPRTPDEEDYYCNYYNNTIYPAQVNAFRQQVAVSQYQNQNANYRYGCGGYNSDNITLNYNPNGYGYGSMYNPQEMYRRRMEYEKQQQENQLKILKKISITAFKVLGYDEEEAFSLTEDIYEGKRFKEEEKRRIDRLKENPVRVRVIRVETKEVICEGNWPVDEKKKSNFRFDPEHDYRFDYARNYMISKQPQIEWVVYNRHAEYFNKMIDKYKHIGFVEFMNNEGYKLVREVRDRERLKQQQWNITHSYNRDHYNQLLAKYENKDSPYNDGIYGMINKFGFGGEMVLDESDGFHYDAKTNSISITCPKDFSKYSDENMRKEAEKQTRRRVAFYNLVLQKCPDLVNMQNPPDLVGRGGPVG